MTVISLSVAEKKRLEKIDFCQINFQFMRACVRVCVCVIVIYEGAISRELKTRIFGSIDDNFYE